MVAATICSKQWHMSTRFSLASITKASIPVFSSYLPLFLCRPLSPWLSPSISLYLARPSSVYCLEFFFHFIRIGGRAIHSSISALAVVRKFFGYAVQFACMLCRPSLIVWYWCVIYIHTHIHTCTETDKPMRYELSALIPIWIVHFGQASEKCSPCYFRLIRKCVVSNDKHLL